MFPLVISFYTKNTPYQLDAHHLIASCEKFGVEHCVEGIDSWGSWELNCAFKPFFIAEMLKKHQRPVLWVDVDAVFVQKPRYLKVFEKDLAAFCDKEVKEDHPSKVRSGTVYVNYSENGARMVHQWKLECQRMLINPERQEEFWEQAALRNVFMHEKNTGSLPLSYIKILGHPIDSQKCPRPVILHLQASRRSK
jgi:hypothetical protein